MAVVTATDGPPGRAEGATTSPPPATTPPARTAPPPEMGGGFRKKEVPPTIRQAWGAEWHRRGYRDRGSMWINVQLSKRANIKSQDAYENKSLQSFVQEVLCELPTSLPAYISRLPNITIFPFRTSGLTSARNVTTADMEDTFAILATWRRDLHFRKRWLVRALVDHEDSDALDWTVLMRDYFDGGETVYLNVFNGDGVERTASDLI